ncbi:MAG TPA: S8 family serine peptidase [Steroidobacteraceae bacterium]|nr:S8 family serine peptidase [Steroidobacteraceae bacterium]
MPRSAVLLLALVAAMPALGGEPPQAPRLVVAFANTEHASPAPAGTTGARYGGAGYRVAQDAHQRAQRIAARYALREVDSWPIRALGMHCVVYQITDGRPASEVLAALSHDTDVLLAQPLNEFHTLSAAAAPAYNDPLYDLQGNLARLQIAQAHARSQGAGVRIALIDTAVDVAHPDLAGRIARTHSYVPGGGKGTRHGTAMAGIIVAVANNHVGIVGIAPRAQLEVFEACWQVARDTDAAACNTFTLAQALAGALAAGTPLVNLSLGGPQDPLLAALVAQGQKRGMIFVGALPGAAAGFPTSIPGVLAAGGSEHPLPPQAFGAPSEHVLTTRPLAQYDFESGSSVAAAEITGVAALLLSASPARLSGTAVEALLRARRVGSRGAADGVDAAAALAQLDAGTGRLQVARAP